MEIPKEKPHSPVRTVVALGSNVHDRLASLRKGVDLWRLKKSIKILGAGRIYESEPYGPGTYSGSFLNTAIVCDCSISPVELRELCHRIEFDCGRSRTNPETDSTSDRTLDCDIIFYGDIAIESGNLLIPHREWSVRDFVLLPLTDIRDHLTDWQKNLLYDSLIRFQANPPAYPPAILTDLKLSL